MKRIILSAFALVTLTTYGQSDGCSAATAISITATCVSPTPGTTIGATQTIAGCTGNADDDVWYQFVATATSHQIVVAPSAGMDVVVQLFSGGCATLASLVCKDDGLTGVNEIINYSGLTIGNSYRIRVYDYFAGSGSGTFTICVTNPPPAPSNDACAGAIPLTVNSTCITTVATTDGASQSQAGCAGAADDDVWFSFVATNSLQNIKVHPIDNLDLVYQVFSGSCGTLSSLACVDNTLTSQDEQENIVGLVPGLTYYIRVYDYYTGTTGDFDICITGTPTAIPTNDEACTAIQLPAVTSSCIFSQFTTVGATASLGSPTPSSCIGGSGAAIGDFSASSSDVWFAITVPASGNVDVTAQPNGGAGSISDGVMVLYSGTCGNLTQIVCSDDNNYPGLGNDLLPLISESGLSPGSTVYLRYFGFGTSTGAFGICVSTATNDDCANALYICDINGYSGSTSASYTPDRPDNMRGNNEDINGVNQPDGINTGGIFGAGGPWGTGSPFFDVNIDNNSWIKFTASATTATLSVSIFDCWVGNYPSGGLQMQVFEGVNCASFVPVSNFEESSTGFIITANGLIIGNDYYLMIDGYAGDICGYTITANSGVQFPDITNVAPICVGASVTLVAPPGATSYDWQHDGSTTQSVTVTPSTTETYFLEVTGLCDFKQTLDVTVIVNPLPNVTVTNGPSVDICDGSSATLIASGASTYTWSNSTSGASTTVSPTVTTNYTVTGVDVNGCVNTDIVAVSVNPNPTLSATPTAVDSDCGASNGALNGALGSGAPTVSYSWSDGSTIIGTSQNLTNIPAGTYFLTITDGNTCSSTFGPYSVVNPGAPPTPSVVVINGSPCLNGSSQLVASNTTPGVTFNWTGPNGFTASGTSINLANVTSIEAGIYCVSSSIGGCTGPSICELITLLANPIVDVTAANNDSTICLNQNFDLTASGASTYTWTGPNGFSSTATSATISNATNTEQGYYFVTGTDLSGCIGTDSILITILPLPIVTATADISSQTYCNGGIATLTATGGSTYSWTGPAGFIDTSSTTTLLDLVASNQGFYIVTAIDAEGCANQDSVELIIITDVPAGVPEDFTLCPGELITLVGSGGTSYTWTGPLGFNSTDQNPLVTDDADFSNEGYYYLTVVDSNNCLGYDSVYVEVTNNADCLFIPNLLTPDNNNLNDTWEITGIDKFIDAEVEIYNRWGNLVFSASPYLNDWAGQVNHGATIGSNGKVPVGTYFYIIRLNEGDKPPYQGFIEVQY